ncbi:MAG: BglG family transcription antiterminator [Bacillota bacterium]
MLDQRGLSRDDILRRLVSAGPSEFVARPAERQRLTVSWLLSGEEAIGPELLQKRLGVSHSTAVNDLRTIENWLGRYGISLRRDPAGAITLQITERQWRQVVADLVAEYTEGGQLLTRLHTASATGQNPSHYAVGELESLRTMIRLSGLDEADRLQTLTALVSEHLGVPATEPALLNLVVHVAIAVSRVRQGKTIPANAAHQDEQRSAAGYSAAERLAEALEQRFQIHLPEPEVGYLGLHLASVVQKRQADDQDSESRVIARDFYRLASSLLGAGPLMDEDDILALALHLKPIRQRLSEGLFLRNPLLDEIKQKLPKFFEVASQAATVVESRVGLRLPEEEIGYLAIHLAAAVEKKKLSRRRVLLVCGSGIGTANLLAASLGKYLPEVEIVGTTSPVGVEEALSHLRVDHVISTIPLDLQDMRVSYVSGIPDQAEIQIIKKRLGLEQEAAPAPAGAKGARIAGGNLPVLSDLLTKNRIALDVPALNWQEAVIAAGDVLVRAGDVDDAYVQSMVQAIEKLGPYVVVAPGCAMPHARPTAAVRRVSMSLVRLREPVRFGNEENDPVDLVFPLAAVDTNTHLKALSQLTKLLKNEADLKRIRTARSVDEVLDVVQRYSPNLED